MASRSSASKQKILQELLKSMRAEAGLRQIDVAKALGISQSMVSKYEFGDRRLDILEVRVLCQLFKITLSDFVRRLEEKLEMTHETD